MAELMRAVVRDGRDIEDVLYQSPAGPIAVIDVIYGCLLYTSDAADDTPCVDLGGRRTIKKKNTHTILHRTKYELSLPFSSQ